MRKIPYIDLKAQNAPIKDQILKAISRVIDRGDFVLGQSVEEFEKNISRYCGSKYAVGVNSGTDALFLSLKALGIGPGDEVITPPNSFLSSTSVIIACGGRPVFVDIQDDLNLDPKQITAQITPNTKAIMPVHLTGKPADMDPIMRIAKEHRLKVIEDAAQAIGAEYKGRRAGSFGDLGCFSLHPVKIFNAIGDGGFITTDDEKLFLTLKQLRNIGLKNRDQADRWGYNSRLDTIQAAVMNVKMAYLDRWISRQRKNADYYINKLKALVKVPAFEKHEKPVFHTFVIQTPQRDELSKFLLENGIETKVHYPIPIYRQEAASGLGYKKGAFPVCDRTTEQILSLPIHHALKQEDLVYIVEKIKDFFNK